MVFKIGSTTFDGELIDDASPQLSAPLDVNGNEIVSTANNNVVIHPNGSGATQVKGGVELNSDDEAVDINIVRHNGTHGLRLGGSLVTSSATELNKLDGFTGDATDLQKIADYTGSATELNLLDLGTNQQLGIFKGSTSVPASASDFTGNTKIIMVY